MKTLLMAIFLLSVYACGVEEDENSKETSASSPSEGDDSESEFKLKGSVTSAFEVEVDNKKYLDMEDFFTKESANLSSKESFKPWAEQGYAITFDAAIGFDDLTEGMTIYVSSINRRGYQSKTKAQSDGTFELTLPSDAAGDTYRIRGNKRVSVILQKGDEKIRWCYNFSAADNEVPYEMKDRPIILDKFNSNLTTYKCEAESSSGSGIEAPNPPQACLFCETTPATVPSSTKLSKGMTKKQVEGILGVPTFIEGSDKWCYSGGQPHAACAIYYFGSCQCSVKFGSDKVVGQDNIKASLLDLNCDWN